MNPKSVLGLILCICLQTALGKSYSQVYVQNGANNPTGFVTYGAPAVYTDSSYARLSAPPIGSVVPMPSMTNVIPPCVSPCVLTNPKITPVAQVPVTPLPATSSAKIVAYTAPNVPVVVAPSKDNGYEYSYVVYDENTGDQKAQRESSDGSVVRGEYSFIQPDGYVREVKYTADDLTGFNVVVKRIPTDNINGRDKKAQMKGKSEPAPCPEPNKESLKVEPTQPSENIELNEVDTGLSTATPSTPASKVEEVTPSIAPSEASISPDASPASKQPKDIILATPEETQAKVQEITEAPASTQPKSNILVSYDDLIRCIQSSIQAQKSQTPGLSPLTYIILPGKPC